MPEPLYADDIAALRVLAECLTGSGYTAAEIAQACGVEGRERKVLRAQTLGFLVKRGLVARHTTKPAAYTITDAGREALAGDGLPVRRDARPLDRFSRRARHGRGPALRICQGAQEHGGLAGSDLLGGLDRHHRRPHMGSAALGHLLTAAPDPMR